MHADELSLHLLVKNEEELLAPLLTLFSEYVGEIVVVDTGSTDTTVSVAWAHSATIVETELNHDFAAARNLGLELVTRPWILHVDADEWPSDELLDWLKGWEPPAKCGAVAFRRHNLVGGQEIGMRTLEWHIRLFRSVSRFEGRIHERIQVSHEQDIISAPLDAILQHYKTIERQEKQNLLYSEWEEQLCS